ncbi:hypothetical protein [Streptomyces chartreusis]|uniref:hypothetical protein n=1 Tax=Streptomyces chartreusis TaxID=1969 RepID=UPI0036669B7E
MSWQSLLWSFLLHDVAGNVLGGLVLAAAIALARQARIAWHTRRIPTHSQQTSPTPTTLAPDHRNTPG